MRENLVKVTHFHFGYCFPQNRDTFHSNFSASEPLWAVMARKRPAQWPNGHLSENQNYPELPQDKREWWSYWFRSVWPQKWVLYGCSVKIINIFGPKMAPRRPPCSLPCNAVNTKHVFSVSCNKQSFWMMSEKMNYWYWSPSPQKKSFPNTNDIFPIEICTRCLSSPFISDGSSCSSYPTNWSSRGNLSKFSFRSNPQGHNTWSKSLQHEQCK